MKRSELLTKLARELDSWPLKTADVPAGMPGMWCFDAAENPEERGVFVWATHNPGRDDDTINVHDWLAEKKRLASEPEAPEWDGEGLPPVGVPIEQKHKDATPEWANPGFRETTIVAMGKQLAIFTHPGSDHETVGRIADYYFRPLRTAAQRAEEEAVSDMAKIVLECPDQSVEDRLRAVYRAGYRKEAS